MVLVACGDDGPPIVDAESSSSGTESSTTDGITSTEGSSSSSSSSSGDGSSSSSESSSSDASSDSSSSTSDAAVCGDDVVEGTEVCDGSDLADQSCSSLGLGFDVGVLGCAADCSSFDTTACATASVCGNGILETGEFCDGFDVGLADCIGEGFTTGVLRCTDDCSGFDTAFCSVCGDGVIEGIEPCDGVNLGGSTCATEGFTFGTLACEASCTFFDTSSCLAATEFGNDGLYQALAFFPTPLPCDDISASGTQVGLSDDSQVSVPIGFTFTVYGTPVTTASIGSNGMLGIGGNAGTQFGNVGLPTASIGGGSTTNFLAPFWDDFNPGLGGSVRHQTLGEAPNRRFVVQWNVTFFSGGNAQDLLLFRVMLHETTNIIDVCYEDTTSGAAAGNNGASATVGFQRNSGSAFQFSLNAPNVTPGLQISYFPL